MAENQIKDVISLEEDRKVREYTEKLRALRADGVTRINDCRIELASLKKNKLVADDEKARRIQALNAEIAKAREVESRNKGEIASLAKEAVSYVNSISKEIEASVNARQNKRMEGAKAFYEKEVGDIKAAYAAREEEIKTRLSGGDPQALKSELEICSYELKSALYDSKSRFKDQIDKCMSIYMSQYQREDGLYAPLVMEFGFHTMEANGGNPTAQTAGLVCDKAAKEKVYATACG